MTVSELKYLMAVKEFSGDDGAKMATLSRSMSVSKVSVYHGMERLEEKGYITHCGKKIALTEAGRDILEEYTLLIGFMCSHLALHCGTPESIAKADAIGAVCALSDVSRNGVYNYVKSKQV